MRKTWSDVAWEDYLFYQQHDRKALEKVNKLLKDIERNGERDGIEHPEPLRGDLSGFWSRHVAQRAGQQIMAGVDAFASGCGMNVY
jgi:toxin YoeB